MDYCVMISVLLMLMVSQSTTYDISPGIPVQITTPGFRFLPATPRPTVTLEMFIDLNCPDSLEQWDIIRPVQVHFGTDKLDLVIQMVALPYHRNGFLCEKGLYVIQDSTQSANVFAYIDETLRMWRNYSTAATVDMSENDVTEMLADMASRVTGINRDLFKENLPQYESATRAAWKYAVKHGASGTPYFFLNGVDLGIYGQPSFNDWVTFLDPIIKAK